MQNVPSIAVFTSATIKMWVNDLRKPKLRSMHLFPYVCINEPFTARSVNLQGGDVLSVDVAGTRDTCAPLSTKKDMPVFLSTM